MVPTILFWSLSGGIQVLLQQGSNSELNYTKLFTEGNSLLVKTVEVSETSSGNYIKAITSVQAVTSGKDTVSVSGRLLVFFENTAQAINRNEIYIIRPILTKITNNGNIGEFNAKRYWYYQGIENIAFLPSDSYLKISKGGLSLSNLLLNIRDKLSTVIDQYLPGQEAAVAKGLILGDRSSIESETTRMFGNTGVMHILAVSGMHVAILVLILNYILQLFPRYISKRTATLISLIIVWGYSLMTGFSPSVSRAAWMFTFLVGGVLLHRDYKQVNGLIFSALIILLWNPYAIYDIGFQLSYAAMIGIYSFFPYLRKQLYFKQKWLQTLWDGTALGIAAQLFTTPIALYYFHQFPNYFWLTNLALSAYSTLILGLGITLFIVGGWQITGKIVGFALFYIMFSMLWIIRFIDGLPDSVSQGFVLSGWIVTISYLLIIGLYFSLYRRKVRLMNIFLAFSLLLVALIVFNRFQKMTQARMVIANTRRPLLILKTKDKSFIIAKRNDFKNDKLARFASDFQHIYPSQSIDTVWIENNQKTTIRTTNFTLRLNTLSDGVEIYLPSYSYFLPTKEIFRTQIQQIILPSTMNDPTAFHQLNKGAFNLILP